MRICYFTNLDLYSNLALNFMLPELSKHEFNLFMTHQVGNNSKQVMPLRYLSYLERDFMVGNIFRNLNGTSNSFQSFDQIANTYQTTIEYIQSVNDPLLIDKLKEFKPDLFIVIRFGKIFKGEILSIPKKGIINLHSAILPDFKGVMGTLRAMQFQAAEIGATIHYIRDKGIDTGDIIKVAKILPDYNKSILQNIVSIYKPACLQLCGIISQLKDQDNIDSIEQEKGGQYFKYPELEDFHDLKNKGITLFNLEEYASIINQYYSLNKQKLLTDIKNDPKSNNIPAEF